MKELKQLGLLSIALLIIIQIVFFQRKYSNKFKININNTLSLHHSRISYNASMEIISW